MADDTDLTTLPTIALAVWIFGDENLEDITPVSKSPGDTAKVYVRPLGLGQLIKERDPNENYFHVELITEHEKPHSEIWQSFEWKISNAREQRFRSHERKRTIEYTTKTLREKEIVAAIRSQGGPLASAPDGFLAALASTIVSNRSKDLSQVYQAINIAELLQRYAQEDQSSQCG